MRNTTATVDAALTVTSRWSTPSVAPGDPAGGAERARLPRPSGWERVARWKSEILLQKRF